MLEWLHEVAAWSTPIVQILAIPTAVVTFAITVIRVRRWMAELFGEQQRTAVAAEAAASRSGEALDASHRAVESAKDSSTEAKTAADNSRQANDAIEWLAGQLADRDATNNELRERVDRLLGTRARQLADEQGDGRPKGLLIPASAADDDDPATATGRHRLHTRTITTPDEGDPA
jgi:hypothetical protein